MLTLGWTERDKPAHIQYTADRYGLHTISLPLPTFPPHSPRKVRIDPDRGSKGAKEIKGEGNGKGRGDGKG